MSPFILKAVLSYYTNNKDFDLASSALDIKVNTLRVYLKAFKKLNPDLYEILESSKSKKQIKAMISDLMHLEELAVNKVEEKVDLNSKESTFISNRVVTVKDLIKQCGIDTKIWKVDRFICNKWEVARKDIKKELKALGGVWEGFVKDSGSMTFHPLYQVKAWCSKMSPDKQKFPVIQPVSFNVKPFTFKTTKSNSKIKRAILVPDSQTGFVRSFKTGKLESFHDRRCFNLLLQILADVNPDRIVFLGDMLDLAEWSDKFVKKPEFYQTTQASITEFGWWLSKIRSICPNAEIDYLEGNHEERMRRKVFNHVMEAYNLCPVEHKCNEDVLSVPYLLSLDKLNIEYSAPYPAGEVWINDNLRISHGCVARAGSGDTVKAVLKETRTSECFGHIHRIEKVGKTVHSKNKSISYMVFSPGTFARIDGAVPAKNSKVNWQQGLGHVYYEEGNNRFQSDIISISDGKCIFEGKAYIGIDNAVEVSKETGLDLKKVF